MYQYKHASLGAPSCNKRPVMVRDIQYIGTNNSIVYTGSNVPHFLFVVDTHLATLMHIFLSASTLPIFCTAMDTQTDTAASEQTPADSSGELVPFPSLECIHLRDLRLSPMSSLDLLTSLLKQRSTSRSPIRKVRIMKSKLPEKWVDELLTIVPVVSFSER